MSILLIMTLLVCGFPAFALATNDMSDWAVEEINAAIAVGLVPQSLQGNYTSGTSRLEAAQMCKTLIERAVDKPINVFLDQKGVSINSTVFSDTNDEAVLAANALGILVGMGDGRFAPNSVLTRAHLAEILCRDARVLGMDTSGYVHNFVDVNDHWLTADLGWLACNDILRGVGDNRFDPDGILLREQVIAAKYRLLLFFMNSVGKEISANAYENERKLAEANEIVRTSAEQHGYSMETTLTTYLPDKTIAGTRILLRRDGYMLALFCTFPPDDRPLMIYTPLDRSGERITYRKKQNVAYVTHDNLEEMFTEFHEAIGVQ